MWNYENVYNSQSTLQDPMPKSHRSSSVSMEDQMESGRIVPLSVTEV